MLSRVLISIIGLGLLTAITAAQSVPGCPVVAVSGPAGLVSPGEIARYSIRVDPIDSQQLAFNWSLSHGIIRSGQGTQEIEVVQPELCVTATVEVSGLPENCPTIISESSCGHPRPVAEKLVEISGAPSAKDIGRIRKALGQHGKKSYDQFYFIVSGTNRKNSREKKIATLKGLFKDRPDRATYILSDKTDDKISMWAVPPGADSPEP